MILIPALGVAEPLNLRWDKVTVDTDGNPAVGVKYKLFRSANGGDWKIVATREGNTFTWYFPVLGHYVYRVIAFNNNGNSMPSSELKIWIETSVKAGLIQPTASNEVAVWIDSKGREP